MIALIDGDVVCYMACEDRYRNDMGYTEVTLGDAPIDPAADAAYLKKAYKKLLKLIDELCEVCFTTEYRIAVAGDGNFRKDIYPDYKKNRHSDPKKRNRFVPQLRKMLAKEGLATEAHGQEADDLLRIWAEECILSETPYVVMSIDKDLLMIEGRHYRIHKQEFTDMSKGDSLKFYYEQLLQGDPVDSIPGVTGVGPIKAKKFLSDSPDEKSHREIVMQTYYTVFKERWREELFLTGRLIYLKKHKDDWFTLDDWPVIEFEEIDDKPKKTKGKKKMEPWTIATALAAVDPSNVIGTKAWEAAMLFLAEESGVDIDDEALGAIEVLSNRNGVPVSEVEAYATLRKKFQGVAAPVVVEKESPISDTAKFVFQAKVEEALDVCHGKIETDVGKTIPETVKRVMSEAPSLFKVPEVVAPPSFNPGWGKK